MAKGSELHTLTATKVAATVRQSGSVGICVGGAEGRHFVLGGRIYDDGHNGEF